MSGQQVKKVREQLDEKRKAADEKTVIERLKTRYHIPTPSKKTPETTSKEREDDGENGVFLEGGPSVAEVLQKLRNHWVERTEEECVSLAMREGLSQKEAEALFEHLVDNGMLFWFDRGGKRFGSG